jgi:NarL family two-component system response regulator LiaR
MRQRVPQTNTEAASLCDNTPLRREEDAAGKRSDHMTTCIIVDDNNLLFRAALGSLVREQCGLEVVAETTDAGAALELCCRLGPDVVLMEACISQGNSLDVTYAIKRELPRTSVLILNGYGDPDLLAQAIEVGASGYILKTTSPQQITHAIGRLLEGAYAFDQELATKLLLRLLDKPHTGICSPPPPREPSSNEEGTQATLPASLTHREVEVLRLVAQGHTNCQIARSLVISVSTVKKHVGRATFKLGVSCRTEAAIKALGLGLLGKVQLF